MVQNCEVCESLSAQSQRGAARTPVEVPFDVRRVLLCAGHVRIAENAGVRSFAELRELYGSGRRSFVPRRGRNADAQTSHAPRSAGRRAGDA